MWSVDNPDLHSFPTRRSSDLPPPVAQPARVGASAVPHHPQHDLGGGNRPLARQGPPAALGGVDFLRPSRAAGDRKSTRLNSSHANISYAVFCLKKKPTILRGN